MSDYKPITGELREYATVSWDPWPDARVRLYQMCDRIDAVHAGLERENAELKAELDRLVEPPKDADELPICAGDDVEWLNGTKRGRVTGIGVGEREGWVWVLMEGKNVSIALLASDLHHYVPDTWERIIEDAVNVHGNGFNPLWTDERDSLVARCKKLAGDAE